MADDTTTNSIGEIEEETPLISTQTPDPSPLRTRSVSTKVPEAEVHVYRQGKGPIEVFKTDLGGWDQDQLEIRDILNKYGFKMAYAFNPGSGRGMPIRFNPRNGRSLITYSDGAVVHIDGEPKDSLLKPITKILLGVAVMTFMIILVMKETPEWMKKLNFSGGSFPPWILACVVIVFTRMRKRTRSFLEKHLR
ncbi:uncharacterized protein LOC111379308 [Olea europaea var. sylvestris]|uniref:Uncharacterized protein LOC111379308 n=1 Tax=Olea europaea subsp. europaea TaxID=158383 RepID=A0A8S0V254_OLEEU|nr:uncharacterized protein LOC111379308 [Olea europaea var. sylvestris]CAA3025670.1 uncharacterized protein LOC111379308 [Olea europaea subsp. europaea]